MPRVAVAGFQHETNTFAPTRADLDAFERPGAWPGLVEGAALAPALAGANVPAAGFLHEARLLGIETVPLLWCEAGPSGPVTEAAFETLVGRIVDGVRGAGALDAVYLDLHGAMVAEHVADADGETLARVRAALDERPGDRPLVASLDMHANVSAAMVERATLLVGYRTYPHVDMAETGARAARALAGVLAHGAPARAYRQASFLVPLTWQCTTLEPMRSLMGAAAGLESDRVHSVTLAAGFPPGDVAECGPSVLAYGPDAAAAEDAAEWLAGELSAREGDFRGERLEPDAAIDRALALAGAGGAPRPVVLADTQDNPGGGGTGDTTSLLAALVRRGVRGAVVAMVHDPDAARAAHRAGEGASVDLALGGRSGIAGEAPYAARFTVRRLGDGDFAATGPFYAGARMRLGPMALLETGGVSVVVASANVQAADRAMLRHVGVDAETVPVLALKSSVHFRADFEPIAAAVIVVDAPGANVDDPARLAYRRLRSGVRLGPGGREHRPR